MVAFLTYVGAKLNESGRDFGSDFVKRLQKTVAEIKASREMEGRYMTLQEMLKDERAEGRISGMSESLIKVLSELGSIPEEVVNMINGEDNPEVLMTWLIHATKSENIEQFRDSIK